MATVSRSRRTAAGIAFVVAGGLLLLGMLLGISGVAVGSLPTVLAWVALGVGLLLLGLGAASNTVARVALYVAAAGWLLLALDETRLGLPAAFTLIGALAAALGGAVGAGFLVRRKTLTGRMAVAFVATAAVAAVLLLGALAGITPFEIGVVLTLLFAAGLVLTGVLFVRPGLAAGR